MPSFSAASATLNRSASLIASLLNSVVYFLFSFGVGFLLMDHLWSKFTQFLRCPIFAEGINSTENTYVYWVKKFILFNNKAHPKGLGIQEVEAFLTHLSVA